MSNTVYEIRTKLLTLMQDNKFSVSTRYKIVFHIATMDLKNEKVDQLIQAIKSGVTEDTLLQTALQMKN